MFSIIAKTLLDLSGKQTSSYSSVLAFKYMIASLKMSVLNLLCIVLQRTQEIRGGPKCRADSGGRIRGKQKVSFIKQKLKKKNKNTKNKTTGAQKPKFQQKKAKIGKPDIKMII